MLNYEEIFPDNQILNKKILIITMFSNNNIINFFKNKEVAEVVTFNNILSTEEKQICQIENLRGQYPSNYFDIIIIQDVLKKKY